MVRFALILIVILISGLGLDLARASTHPHILSFKIWKQKKIDEAKSVVAELKHEGKRPTSQVKFDDDEEQSSSISHRLTQAELNLGVARELSANDYFVLYVTPQFKDNVEAIKEASKSLGPKDVADILGAYQKRLEAPEVYGSKNSVGDPSLDQSGDGQNVNADGPPVPGAVGAPPSSL